MRFSLIVIVNETHSLRTSHCHLLCRRVGQTATLCMCVCMCVCACACVYACVCERVCVCAGGMWTESHPYMRKKKNSTNFFFHKFFFPQIFFSTNFLWNGWAKSKFVCVHLCVCMCMCVCVCEIVCVCVCWRYMNGISSLPPLWKFWAKSKSVYMCVCECMCVCACVCVHMYVCMSAY